MLIELHIITNCIKSAPDPLFIKLTHDSFVSVFGDIPTIVWCDPKPRPEVYDQYVANIRAAITNDVRRSGGLVDSYLGMITESCADYIFCLEHDWLFNEETINHSLDDIVRCMKHHGLYYLRFNRSPVLVRGMVKWAKERISPILTYCMTNCWSGNPHIIDRRQCLALNIPGRVESRTPGITMEKALTRDAALECAVYGGKKHPPTIFHLDGRSGDPKPFWTKKKKMQMKKLDKKQLGIIVPAYNLPEQAALMERFLTSLQVDARPTATYEVLFVTPDRFDVTTAVAGREYFNIAKAYNAGLHYFKDRVDFIACTDIDLIFPPGFIDYSLEKAAQKPHTARVRCIDADSIHPRDWDAWMDLQPMPGTGAWNCMRYADYHAIGGFCEDMYGWGGIDTDFKQAKIRTFGRDNVWYDHEKPLMHVNHEPRTDNAPRRPSENIKIQKQIGQHRPNYLERYDKDNAAA